MKFSIERIFQSCNLHRHCLAAHLTIPIHIDENAVSLINILKLVVSETQEEILFRNIAEGINTISGKITVEGFTQDGNPLHPISITFPLENIYDIESIEKR